MYGVAPQTTIKCENCGHVQTLEGTGPEIQQRIVRLIDLKVRTGKWRNPASV
jgi:hypothetical protein